MNFQESTGLFPVSFGAVIWLISPQQETVSCSSTFPKDCPINHESIVWSWIAEGFISGDHGNTPAQGENYLNELINRNMIAS